MMDTQGIDDPVLEFIGAHEIQMFSLLAEMVRIQSGTYNKRGVDALADLIRTSLENTCLNVQRIPQEKYGDHLLAVSPTAADDKRGILVVGHMDTVFPEDSSFKEYWEDENHAYGPGVIDMKGGLVVAIFACMALQEAGFLGRMPVRFVCNSDEEVGSPSSGPILHELAARSMCAFVLEAGGLDGGIVTGRKGRLGVRVEVQGEAGHAAFAAGEKPSAILELSHKIIDLEALNDPARGITVNVGQVEGGIGPNTVPPHASAQVDIRVTDSAQRQDILEELQRVVDTLHIRGTSSQSFLISERPTMLQSEVNRELFRTARDLANRLGIEVKEEFRSGVSDANLIASRGVPVLDGLGPIGALDHSESEYMVKSSLVERTKLFSLLLLQTWKGWA